MQTHTCFGKALGKLLAVGAFGAVVLGANEAAGQPFVYVAKFVCGRAVTVQNVPPPVATGFYFTAVNVHTIDENKFDKRFSVALPSEKPGKVSQTFTTPMKPNEALEIDCPDILKHLEMPPTSFAKGFVTIQTERELDVVAVYTAAATATGNVITMEVERVPKR
jgi:hypothetical protein